MPVNFKAFLADEDGGTVVTWVVLTASCMSLGLSMMALISNGLHDSSRQMSAVASSYEVNNEFDTQAEINDLLQQAADTPAPQTSPVAN